MIRNTGAWYVFGCNTDIGKTVFTAGLCLQACLSKQRVKYIKPVQTGAPQDCDASFVKKLCADNSYLTSKTFFAFSDPISPHRIKNKCEMNDASVMNALKDELKDLNQSLAFIEGAGGILSPTLDGKLQCNMYREIRLPIVFIGDSRLGGISSTISGIESAKLRGFDIVCLLLFEGVQENHIFLKEYYKNEFPIFTFNDLLKNCDLAAWYGDQADVFSDVFNHLLNSHEKKLERFKYLSTQAKKNIWWPFTQHKLVTHARVIDSAYGDDFCVVDPMTSQENSALSQNVYDASASWWTQNIGHADTELAQTAAYAAGRYGHVMFPRNAHEPVVKLVEKLLATVGKNWATRVFFTDNGSTAVEVALKMAFRKSCGVQKSHTPIVLGLKGSYHGDTHAAMDAACNTFENIDHWRHSRNFLLDYPKIYLKNKKYCIQIPSVYMQLERDNSFENKELEIETHFLTMHEFFSLQRQNENLAEIYTRYIDQQFLILEEKKVHVGACLLEGVLQGSSGMNAIDPLFQRILVHKCQKKGIPVILDEVFTGFWRLGEMSAAHMLNIKPDIACYGKLLTGGLLPLAVVLTKEHIFDEFLGEDLSTALLHGHSYTASPVSCAVATKAIEKIAQCLHFDNYSQSLTNMWNLGKINELSTFSNVERVVCLGSVFAVELKDLQAHYSSSRAKDVILKLHNNFIDARPLGNVIYLMAGYNTSHEKLMTILEVLMNVLKEDFRV